MWKIIIGKPSSEFDVLTALPNMNWILPPRFFRAASTKYKASDSLYSIGSITILMFLSFSIEFRHKWVLDITLELHFCHNILHNLGNDYAISWCLPRASFLHPVTSLMHLGLVSMLSISCCNTNHGWTTHMESDHGNLRSEHTGPRITSMGQELSSSSSKMAPTAARGLHAELRNLMLQMDKWCAFKIMH